MLKTKDMSDRELMTKYHSGELAKKALIEELYVRYAAFVHKHWAILSRQLQKSALVESYKGDFYGEAAIALIKTIDAIKPEKITDDKWKFLGYYGFYLKNTRTVLLRKILKQYKNETSLYAKDSSGEREVCIADIQHTTSVVHDVEDTFFKNREMEAYNKAVEYCERQLWTKNMKLIWEFKSKGDSIRAVCKQLGMKYHTYRKQVLGMENQVREITMKMV